MGKVTFIRKARKEHICEKCSAKIPVGKSYYRGKLNFHPDIIRCENCGLKSYEVTTSEYVKSVAPIVEEWEETYGCTEDSITSISEDLEAILDELQENLDNLPENLQNNSPTSELLNERIDAVQQAIDELDIIDVDELKGDAIENLDLDEFEFAKTKEFEDMTGDAKFDAIVGNPEKYDKLVASIISESLENDINVAVTEALSSIEY